MPLYADRFSGHLESDDPRGPLTGAGGCPWPTIPPYRVQLSSTNATGNLESLNWNPIILEQNPGLFPHGFMIWDSIILPGIWYNATLYKIWTPESHPEYDYTLTLFRLGWTAEVSWTKNETGKCNTDLVWGDLSHPYGGGSFGSGFTQFQVEYDQTRHPNWMPPT